MNRPTGNFRAPLNFSASSFTVSRLVGAALLSALVPLAVAAASDGEGAAHHGSILDLGKFWMNFGIYVALLVVLLKKPIKSGWASRRARIADSVSSATSEMAEAERALAAVEALTKNLVVEQERARGEIISQGELEVQAVARAAAERAARIKSQVKELLEGETRSAEAQFRSSLIAQAVELSKDRFKSGDYAARQSTYVEAAADRAKRLVR
jgi:F0F1-type ATP synthase membrane subunit b/b'